jgi:hypothetical protein
MGVKMSIKEHEDGVYLRILWAVSEKLFEP